MRPSIRVPHAARSIQFTTNGISLRRSKQASNRCSVSRQQHYWPDSLRPTYVAFFGLYELVLFSTGVCSHEKRRVWRKKTRDGLGRFRSNISEVRAVFLLHNINNIDGGLTVVLKTISTLIREVFLTRCRPIRFSNIEPMFSSFQGKGKKELTTHTYTYFLCDISRLLAMATLRWAFWPFVPKWSI